MTNEEIALKIQAGDASQYVELWDRVRLFVCKQANRYIRFFPDSTIEVDDLTQAAYLALVEAVKTFDPDAGAGLLHHLSYYLRKTWRTMYGLRGGRDPLDDAVSLDDPLSEDDDTTLLDVTSDPAAELAFDQADGEIFIDELRAALERALDKAPHGDIVRRRYFQGQTQREIAEDLRCSPSAVHQRERAAIRYLRSGPFTRELRSFDYYHGTGLQSWKNNRASVEERFVIEQENQMGRKRYGHR